MGKLLLLAALALGGIGLFLEMRYRLRPGNDLEMTAGEWSYEVFESTRYLLVGKLELINHNPYREVMVPQLSAQVTLLSSKSLAGISHTCTVTPLHSDAKARADGYWSGYIVQPAGKTAMEIRLEIFGEDLNSLQSAWLQVSYDTYGPEGQVDKIGHVVLPLSFPTPDQNPQWRSTPVSQVLPIKTHILSQIDRPTQVVERYVLPHAQPGDIVAISESPLAIMQQRLVYHRSVQIGWLAKRLCQFFYRTSSFATAGGLQTLIDMVGPWRVIYAFIGGAIGKTLLKQPGLFYTLAGDQARLFDDVTGTLPPYDQFIVFGPTDSQKVVDEIKAKTGIDAVIVDANDLQAVDILAASAGVSLEVIRESLRKNPAGNSDEQTPVVLIRPNKSP